VVGPVLDFTLALDDVDPDRIALIGLSLGAHLAPRAAAHDRRVAALLTDCGSFDLRASLIDRLPGPLAAGYVQNKQWARAALTVILRVVGRKPIAGWGLRRGQMVHGVATPIAYLDDLARYSLADQAGHITCPTWVCHAENDDIGASAPQLAAAVTGPSVLIHFTAEEGAGDHCEQGARMLYHARSFAWLDDQIRA
jgi:pimeloyl-ACP methyl ester carboxylesterase